MKITKKKLTRILEHLPQFIQKNDIPELVGEIYKMNNDKSLIKKPKTYKQLKPTDKETKILGKYINIHRIKAKHKGVRPYKEKTRDWNKLKELTSIVAQFINEFELDHRDGMNEFIKISLTQINKKSKASIISKMVMTYDSVITEYEDRIEMLSDSTPEETERIFNRYKAMIIKQTGIRGMDPVNQSEMIYFYQMKKLAKDNSVSPYTFMEAQFEGLEWTGSYPSPSQLVGQKAIERLFKSSFESTDKSGFKNNKLDLSMVEKLKKLKRN